MNCLSALYMVHPLLPLLPSLLKRLTPGRLGKTTHNMVVEGGPVVAVTRTKTAIVVAGHQHANYTVLKATMHRNAPSSNHSPTPPIPHPINWRKHSMLRVNSLPIFLIGPVIPVPPTT
ncbi:hypothetical protein HanIR_Chr04g0186461 [Helianthus annuus]|nr:hypothetical protein HanIR_Chr04g0186461 [Helianthus annuus]